MTEALDNIFSTILQSEMIAHANKEKIRQRKDAIDQLSHRLYRQESLTADLLKRKSQLTQGIAAANINLKVLKCKEKSLSKELEMIKEKAAEEKSKFAEMSATMRDIGGCFVADVNNFSRDYSPCCKGFDRRINASKEALESLKMEEISLQSDIKRMSDKIYEVQLILDQKNSRINELKEITDRVQNLQKHINDEINKTSNLENVKSQLVTEPEQGAEFIKLKEELQLYDVTELQVEIDELQNNLNNLSKMLQIKEAQHLRQQYRQWLRQQEHAVNEPPLKKEFKVEQPNNSTSTNQDDIIEIEDSDPSNIQDSFNDDDIKMEHEVKHGTHNYEQV